jgi:hypothetical protein
MLQRALIDAHLGDGCFWKHPESRRHNLVYTSIHKEWLEFKQQNLLSDIGSTISCARKGNAKNCFRNAKPLYQLKSHVHTLITEATTWAIESILDRVDVFDLAIWFLDDGCCFKRSDKNSYRTILSIGALSAAQLFPAMQRLFKTEDLGRVCLNNSKASDRNLSWIILNQAREIAPECLQYKVPLW